MLTLTVGAVLKWGVGGFTGTEGKPGKVSGMNSAVVGLTLNLK